uniref:Uncharacterized protein n=1 Tax=Penaeus monodon majanivirus A TaxID=2984271 RepID=A0A9C7BLD1_9VIRU|nr:MAG: hypothetical protein [Penaeus monodon majanivirus A]
MGINNNETFRSDSAAFPSAREYIGTTLKSLRNKHKKGLTLKKCRYLEKTFNRVHDYLCHSRSGGGGGGGGNEALVAAIAPHAFNEHAVCKASWCSELQKNFNQVSKITFDEKRRIIMDLKDMFSTTLALSSSDLVKSSRNANESEDVIMLLPSPPPDSDEYRTYKNKKTHTNKTRRRRVGKRKEKEEIKIRKKRA